MFERWCKRSISPQVLSQSFSWRLEHHLRYLLTDGHDEFLKEEKKNLTLSNPPHFSHDSSDNVAHLQVHRLMNLHLNICQRH